MEYNAQFELRSTDSCDDEWGVVDELASQMEDVSGFTVVREVHGGQFIATTEG